MEDTTDTQDVAVKEASAGSTAIATPSVASRDAPDSDCAGKGNVASEDLNINCTGGASVGQADGIGNLTASLGDDEDEDEDEDGDSSSDEDGEDDEDNPLSDLPKYILKRVTKLEELNADRDKIMEQYLVERAALEQKFAKEVEGLYKERAAVVSGERDDTIAAGEVKEEQDEDADTEKVAGVPQFWACAMAQVETIAETICEEDVDCLEHLRDVRCEDHPDGKGFTLFFDFNDNDYFSNKWLSKTYGVPNLLLSDEPILKVVKGTDIDWKADKSLTYRTLKKKQRGKGKNAGQIRTVTKIEKSESFFHWFNPPKMPPVDDMDEEMAEELEEAFDEDYEIALAFRNHVVPKAVLWFSGKAGDEEMEIAYEDQLLQMAMEQAAP